MDFKVTYLDAGLTSAYLDSEVGSTSSGGGGGGGKGTTNGSVGHSSTSGTSNKVPKRYKSHLRDFLSTQVIMTQSSGLVGWEMRGW